MNAFAFFELQPSFLIDLEVLKNRYLLLSKKYHPDLNRTDSLKEKVIWTQKTAELNQAYRLLTDDFRRAKHLLELWGLSILSENKILHNPTFLEKIFELEEKIDFVKEHPKEKQFLVDELYQDLDNLKKRISDNFSTAENMNKDSSEFQVLSNCIISDLYQFSYLQKITNKLTHFHEI